MQGTSLGIIVVLNKPSCYESLVSIMLLVHISQIRKDSLTVSSLQNAGYQQYSSIVAQHSHDLMSELDDKKCLHTTI